MQQVFPEAYPGLVVGSDDRLTKHFESDTISYELFVEQSRRIGDTLRIFTDERLMSDHAVDVARFQAIIDAVRSESTPRELRHNLSIRTADYLTDPESPAGNQEVDYMLALWSDMPVIDAAAKNYRARLEQHGTFESYEALEKLNGATPITEADWHDIRVGVDIPAIVALSKQVNVESILARSALVLDRVATATEYDNELLQDILEVETVHAPLLYLLGLPAWEAILKHHAEKARIMATGNEEKIAVYNEASAYIEQVRGSGLVNTVLQDVLGVPDVSNDQFSFIVDNEETPYGSKSYFSAIRCGEGEDERSRKRIISRIKSPGSYAHKVLHNEKYKNERPQDVFAATVITSSIEEMTAAFKEVYANIQALPSCELVSAASKSAPVHIKGKQAYREAVKSGLSDIFTEDQFDESKVDEDANEPFQVLKITFTIRGEDGLEMPVEIQFQTRKDRNASRLGGASHLCSKDKDAKGLPGHINGESADQKSVNDRKWAMAEGGETIFAAETEEIRRRQRQGVRELQLILLDTSSDDYLAA